MAKYVITGGAGFIGSNLAERLLGYGHDVVIVDNLSTGRRENLDGLQGNLDLQVGEIQNLPFLTRSFQGTEVVFHQAALPSVPRSVKNPAATNNANVDGTLNVLLAARDCGVRRVVLASSSSVYGDTRTLPKVEDMPPNPLSPYAVTKYVGELYAGVFHRTYGLETVCLRYFNVFGPRQNPLSEYAAVIPAFITRILEGKSPVVFGDGEQTRDFTYIENVVEANLLAGDAPLAPGKVFNIGCGSRYSLNHLIACINRTLETDVRPVYQDTRPGDVRDSMASIDKALSILGYEPKVSFDEGLRRTIDWFKRERS